VVGDDDDEKRGDDTVLDEPVPEPEVGRDLVVAFVPADDAAFVLADEAASEVVPVPVVPTPSLTELSPVVPS